MGITSNKEFAETVEPETIRDVLFVLFRELLENSGYNLE